MRHDYSRTQLVLTVNLGHLQQVSRGECLCFSALLNVELFLAALSNSLTEDLPLVRVDLRSVYE